MTKQFEPLFKVSSNGQKVSRWSVESKGDTYTITTGYLDGQQQSFPTRITDPKNSKSLEEQADRVAESAWNLKRKTMYPSIEEARNAFAEKSMALGGYKPMLAEMYDPSKKQKFNIANAMIQPKLDGCLAGNTKIHTNLGNITIKDIVENRREVSVTSYNEETQQIEFKPIVNWFNNGEEHFSNWIYIIPEHGKQIRCTRNHKLLTTDGWKEAGNLDPKHDKIYATRGSHYRNCLIAGTVLGDSIIRIETRSDSSDCRLQFRHSNIKYFEEKVRLLNMSGSIQDVVSGYGSECKQFASNTLVHTDFPLDKFYDIHNTDLRCRKNRITVNHKLLVEYIIPEALALWICDDGAISYNNGNKQTPRLCISTYRFSDEQLDEFIKFFKIKYNVMPVKQLDKRLDTKNSNSSLFFTTKDTLYILNILRNSHIRTMEYKFYFPTEEYVVPAQDDFGFVPFEVRRTSRLPMTVKYDIEVADNHNYCADGIIVHNCRIIAKKVDEDVLLYSRSGALKTTIPHINDQLHDIMQDGEILDGELYAHGMELEDILSLVQSSKNLRDTTDLQYWIYDVPRIDDLKESEPYFKRLNNFMNRYGDSGNVISKDVRLTPTTQLESVQEIEEFHTSIVNEGYEGAILRNPLSAYQNKRTKDLLKVKTFQDAEFEIIAVNEGKGKLEGHAGSFVCRMPDGRTFNTKLKGDTENLTYYFEHPEEAIGRMLTVQFFSYTQKRTPRFPVGIRIRDAI